jgi:hypothetical protein
MTEASVMNKEMQIEIHFVVMLLQVVGAGG